MQGVKDVRTHHRMAAEVNDPDNISGQDMLLSGCDVHECRVSLPEGVRIGGARHMSSWGIRMELIRIALCAPCHLGEGSLHLAHADGPLCAAQLSPPGGEFRAPTFHIRNSVHRHFTSGYLIAGWERRTFQLLQSDLSGSSDSTYQGVFLSVYSATVFC